jgi:hypothetical protein
LTSAVKERSNLFAHLFAVASLKDMRMLSSFAPSLALREHRRAKEPSAGR